MKEFSDQAQGSAPPVVTPRKPYLPPTLTLFGSVASLTQSGSCNEADDGFALGCTNHANMNGMNTSDRRLKTDVVQIGSHPMGFGLYLFSYKPEFQARCGYGRKFGVMADEVEPLMPEAIATSDDGYKSVSYGMLGISLARH